MGKIWIEVCLISARGLRQSLLLWKPQWYAVGWIDPNNKYCTKVDSSGNSNPTWKTKFSTSVDYSESNFEDLVLNVEVYSREPVFLRERLQGTATVSLKEFMVKYTKDVDTVLKPGSDQVGSFQLRKKNSNKPQGFVDVSGRIVEEMEDKNSYPGDEEGIQLMDYSNGNTLDNSHHVYPPEQQVVLRQRPGTHPMASESGPSYPSAGGQSYQPQRTPPPLNGGYNIPHLYSSELRIVQKQRPGTHPMAPESGPNYPSAGGPSYQPQRNPPPSNGGYNNPHLYSSEQRIVQKQRPGTHPMASESGPSYQSAGGASYPPPQMPPPSHVGYIPTFPPRTDHVSPTYMSMPPSGRTGQPGFGMGMGAGALAAGALIFGDDFMPGFNAPAGFQDANLTITPDPPFY